MTQATHLPGRAHAPPDPVHAITVRNLHVRYGDFEAVRGIDLDVRRGEVFALLGTNGAGKTTTLEALEGFGTRSAGAVSARRPRRSKARISWSTPMPVILELDGANNP